MGKTLILCTVNLLFVGPFGILELFFAQKSIFLLDILILYHIIIFGFCKEKKFTYVSLKVARRWKRQKKMDRERGGEREGE